jgi:flagellin-like protein
MKANRKFIEENEAVSAVIGVILMVAITVAIAATVYVYVSGMIGGTATKTSTLSMNIYSRNDANNQVIWLVSGIEGEAILNTSTDKYLLDSAGSAATFTYTFNDVNNDSYINAGDTFSINTAAGATGDGYYVFMISDTGTGATIFKSTSTKY